jgi:hypothetical protein
MANLQLMDQALPDFLQTAGVSELTKTLAGRSGVKRIVPKNGIFRLVVGGEEMGKVKGDLNVVIVNAAPKVGRIFYAKSWSPDAEPTSPDCFSNDGKAPDAKAENPQSANCDDCPNNIKGSGQGNSKACRYSRRIAVLLEQDFGTNLEGEVYQLNLASKSLFGDGGDGTYTFENYTKYLSSNGKSIDFMVSQVSFNENNDNQSVLFSPTRYINRPEYEVVQKVANTEKTKSLVIMTPSQADGVVKKPATLAAPKAAEIDEPVKRTSKKTEEAPVEKKKLADVISAWSDED